MPLLYVPDARRTGDGVRWLAWMVWRYRSELGPVFLAAVIAVAARGLHARHPSVWPVLLALTGVVGGFLLAVPDDRLNRLSHTPVGGLLPAILERRPERLYAGAVVAVAGCWLSVAVAVGPGWGPLPALALWGTPVVAWPWWAHRRRRARVRVERKLEAWPHVAESIGLAGSRVQSAMVDTFGYTARIALHPGQTVRQAIERVPALESGLAAKPGAVRITPDPARADRMTVRVVETDPHAEPIPWPGPSVNSILQPVELGLSEDGEPVPVRLAYRNLLIGGIIGSGKSGVLNVILANWTACRDVVLWGIDLKGGIELSLWSGCLDRLATTPREAVEVFHDAVTELEARAEALTGIGRRLWEPSADSPALVIIVDEWAELPEQAWGPADSAARRGRATAVTLCAATQRPTQKAMGHNAVRSQMDVRICLRVRERADTDLILGQGAYNNGWSAPALDAPGKFLISAPEHTIPRRNRAYLLTDNDVATIAEAHSRLRPSLPTIRPAADPVVNLRKEDDTGKPGNGNEGRNDGRVVKLAAPTGPENPEIVLWKALLDAGPEGVPIGELMNLTGMGRRWVYYRLSEHAHAGRAYRTGRGWHARATEHKP